jgi:hypothetical protein
MVFDGVENDAERSAVSKRRKERHLLSIDENSDDLSVYPCICRYPLSALSTPSVTHDGYAHLE